MMLPHRFGSVKRWLKYLVLKTGCSSNTRVLTSRHKDAEDEKTNSFHNCVEGIVHELVSSQNGSIFMCVLYYIHVDKKNKIIPLPDSSLERMTRIQDVPSMFGFLFRENVIR